MKVHWIHTALGHLDTIHQYIAQDSVQYALRNLSHQAGPGRRGGRDSRRQRPWQSDAGGRLARRVTARSLFV